MTGADRRPIGVPDDAEVCTEEALLDEEAERVFFGAAMRAAPGMREAAAGCRAEMAAAGASEDEINQALLALARDHVFPPETMD